MELKLYKSMGIFLGDLRMESHNTLGVLRALDASIKEEKRTRKRRGRKKRARQVLEGDQGGDDGVQQNSNSFFFPFYVFFHNFSCIYFSYVLV